MHHQKSLQRWRRPEEDVAQPPCEYIAALNLSTFIAVLRFSTFLQEPVHYKTSLERPEKQGRPLLSDVEVYEYDLATAGWEGRKLFRSSRLIAMSSLLVASLLLNMWFIASGMLPTLHTEHPTRKQVKRLSVSKYVIASCRSAHAQAGWLQADLIRCLW